MNRNTGCGGAYLLLSELATVDIWSLETSFPWEVVLKRFFRFPLSKLSDTRSSIRKDLTFAGLPIDAAL